MAAKRLLDLSRQEQLAFLESFDTIFCDVDGVLWDLGRGSIEGNPEGIRALRDMGKKLYFVTNNCFAPLDVLLSRLEPFEATKEEVVRPSTAIAWYLKEINFDKELYVVGFRALKDELQDAGFKVIYDEAAPVEENVIAIAQKLRDLRPEVGAVIVDMAINVDYMALQKCVEYISKRDALFLAGAYDPVIPFKIANLIGSSHFTNAIAEVTGKTPILLSKPGKDFAKLLEDKLGPIDPKRVLVIGDSPVTDMALAANRGYQKLMPLTGYMTKDDLKNWKFEERLKPDYVVDSIATFHTIFNSLEVAKL